ncbi:MAG: hypothetical protein AB1405_04940 [Bdellovibrionota bacterium]
MISFFLKIVPWGFLALLGNLALSSPARADDWAVMLGKVEVRERPGFSQEILETSAELDLYKVLGEATAKGEGDHVWYEIILREERQVRKAQTKGWVVQLPGEADPLLKMEVPVFKTPGPDRLIGNKKSAFLSLTGVRSPDGRWHEVTYEDRIETVRNQLGYVPASMAIRFRDANLQELVPRVQDIRSQNWPLEWKVDVLKEKIRKGFDRKAVRFALGEPSEISVPKEGKQREVWIYKKGEKRVGILFKNGKVVSWKTADEKKKKKK